MISNGSLFTAPLYNAARSGTHAVLDAVPAGSYYLASDGEGIDSAELGPFPASAIRGVLVRRLARGSVGPHPRLAARASLAE